MAEGLGGGAAVAVGAGLNEPLTMADRDRQQRTLEDLGASTEAAADLAGTGAFRQAAEARAAAPAGTQDDFSYGDLAIHGTRRAAASMLRGGARMADEWLDLPDSVDAAAEVAAAAIGPSEEQDARAAEFSEGKGILGRTADAIVSEAPTVLGTIGAGVAAGMAFGGPVGATLGGLLGAVQGATRLFDEATQNLDDYNRNQIAAERGIDPSEVSDDEVRARFSDSDRLRASGAAAVGLTGALPITRILSKLPGGQAVLSKVTNRAIERRSVLAGAGKEAAAVGMLEGAQEVGEELALDVLTNRTLHDQIAMLPEKDIRTVAEFVRQQKGEDYAVSFLAGFGLGAAPGAVAGANEASAGNRVAEDRIKRTMGMAEQRGARLEELEAAIKADPEKAKQLPRIAGAIDRQQTHLDQAEALLQEARGRGASDEEIARIEALRDRRAAQLDRLGDGMGKWLGIEGWKSGADVRRARRDSERQRRRDALDRLKAQNEEVAVDDLDGEAASRVADRLEQTEAAYERAAGRHQVVQNPERKAKMQEELDAARQAQREARIEAAMTLRGRTQAQAIREVDKRDRLDRQREAREEAVARQTELELPETMEPSLRQQRAQEIVDAFEARPMDGTKGLQQKIRRLERQRRAATQPETIDRLTDEIADLEARRGLSPPAVEAARRVLQEMGPAPQAAGLEEASPEAGADVEAEGAPDAETRPAGSEEVEGAPETPGAEPAGPTLEQLSPRADERSRAELTESARAIAEGTATPWRRAAFAVQARNASGRPVSEAEIDTVAARIAEAAGPATEPAAGEGSPLTPPETAPTATEDGEASAAGPAGFDSPTGDAWVDLMDDFRGIRGLDAIEAAMAAWTRETGYEVAAHITPEGEILGIGTNSLTWGVMSPAAGFGDPEVIFTHTHPVGLPFSQSDVRAMFVDGGQTFRAVLPDGSAIEMKPLRAIAEPEFDALQDAIISLLPQSFRDEVIGGDFALGDRILSEAVIRALDAAGVIDYTRAWSGLPPRDMEYVNAAVDVAEDAIADLRARTDGRPHPAKDSSYWRSDGEPRAEQEEDAEVDEDEDADPFDLGGRLSDERRGRKRAAADPERVAELARDVVTRAKEAKGAARRLRLYAAIRDGQIGEKQIADAIMELLQSNGNKLHYAVHFAAQRLYPETNFGDKLLLEKVLGKAQGYARTRKPIYRYAKETQEKIDHALQLLHDIRLSGHGEFTRTPNQFITRQGTASYNFFHGIDDDLAAWVGYTAPAQSQLFPPLEDPGDTSTLVRDPKTLFGDEALEPMRRTARYMQQNAYDIDEQRLMAIPPNRMISSKKLGEMNLTRADLDRHDRLFEVDPEVFLARWRRGADGRNRKTIQDDQKPDWISDEDWAFMRDHGPALREMQRRAKNELKNIRDGYRLFRQTHGPDAKLGHVWQIDSRGRIYPDGQFHPQLNDAIKATLSHEGRNLIDDMSSIDASASGWQITAIMARDEELAPRVNLGRGQANDPTHTKRDLYATTIEGMRRIIAADAAGETPGLSRRDRRNAEILNDLWPILPLGNGASDRNKVKKPIIAMNYGGAQKNFVQAFTKLFKTSLTDPADRTGRRFVHPELEAPYGYLARTAMRALDEQAPRANRLQSWAIDGMTRLVEAVEAKYGKGVEVDLRTRIGLDGAARTWKHGTVEVTFVGRAKNQPVYKLDENGQPERDENGRKIELRTIDDSVTHSQLKVRRPEVSAGATARSLWANLVQSLDAAVLHRTVERYKQATNGAFITVTHDALIVPKEHEGAAAAAYRESLREIMAQHDYPRRLYEDIVAQARRHGVEVDIEPFTDYGTYSLDDIDTSTPVFGEDADGNDYVPPYSELPERGAELRAEGGRPRPPAATPEPAPEQETEPGPKAPPEATRPPPVVPSLRAERQLAERAAAVEVASYMEQLPEGGQLLQTMRDAAENPHRATAAAASWVEDYLFNGLAPIRRLEIGMKGELGIGAESAFKNAEMAINDSGRQEMLLYYGAAGFGQHGEYTVAPETLGLKKIFELAAPHGSPDQGQRMADWQEWLAARREQELQKREGYKPILKPAELAAGLAKGEGRPEFQQAADAWKAFNDANLTFLRDSGRISTAQMEAMQADDFYVPFYRADQRIDGTSPELVLPEYKGGGKGGSLLARDPGIHKIVGGDKMRIQNLMHNMIRNSQAIVAAGMRNRAANMTFDLMTEAGLAETVPISSKKPDENAVRMWRDGEEVWVVPRGAEAKPLMIALAGMQPLQLSRFMSIGRGIAQIFRQGITLTPPFMLRNAIRGATAAGLMTSGANLTGAHNTLSGFKDVLKKGAATQAFKAQTGMGDYRFGNTDAGFGKNDILIEFGMAPKTAGYRFRQFMERMEEVGTATELADRVAAMQTMIDRGMRPDEAAYQALTIMNYGRRGASNELRVMLPLIPFLNARLQGWSRIAEGAVGRRGAEGRRQALVQLGINGLVYGSIAMAIWGWNQADEERRERYQAEPLWKRLNFHIVYGPGGTTLLLPKAFELGHIFSSIPELFADGMVDYLEDQEFNELGRQVVPGLWKVAHDTVVFSAVPAALAPAYEVWTNYDAFRQTPIEGLRDQSLLPRDRIDSASPISTFLGRDMGLSQRTGISPSVLEHLLDGYGGIYYTFLSSMFDVVAGDLGVAPVQATSPFGDAPFVSPALQKTLGSFFKDSDLQTNRFVEEFYSAKDHVTQIYRSASEAAKQGDVDYARELLVERAPRAPQAYKLINKAQSRMSELNREIRFTRLSDTLSRAEKQKRLQALITARNELSRQVVNAVRHLENEQGASFASVR